MAIPAQNALKHRCLRVCDNAARCMMTLPVHGMSLALVELLCIGWVATGKGWPGVETR